MMKKGLAQECKVGSTFKINLIRYMDSLKKKNPVIMTKLEIHSSAPALVIQLIGASSCTQKGCRFDS